MIFLVVFFQYMLWCSCGIEVGIDPSVNISRFCLDCLPELLLVHIARLLICLHVVHSVGRKEYRCFCQASQKLIKMAEVHTVVQV